MDLGEVASMKNLGVTESFKLKKQVVVSASEAAEMILRSVHLLIISFLADRDAVLTTSYGVHQEGVRVCEVFSNPRSLPCIACAM
jgi:hypothetical protein